MAKPSSMTVLAVNLIERSEDGVTALLRDDLRGWVRVAMQTQDARWLHAELGRLLDSE